MKIHNWLLLLNDRFAIELTDKQLHFIVVGVVGMILYFLIHPIIRSLARRGYEAVISWAYTLTLIIVLTFGIEIGQKVTQTGDMEFADIMFGVGGFLALFLLYWIISAVVRMIRRFAARLKR